MSIDFGDKTTALAQSAEFIVVALANQLLSQEEIGVKLGINLAAVSRRRKRAQFYLCSTSIIISGTK